VNRHVARALLQDAYYQVLDNMAFRLLGILAGVLVLLTFLIGCDPDGIDLLFGWKHYSYDQVMSAVGQRAPRIEDLHVQFVRGLQEALVQGLAGTFGLLFCIAATAFFVPRMLEKGAADTLFSRPVGRFTLLLARYGSGVLFVAALSFLLVLGMHLGFLVSSGYSDPAFLWSALTLTYAFALVHSVSVLVAVVTRSSVAAILVTLLFFGFTGCIHQSWITAEHARAVQKERVERGEEDEGKRDAFAVLIGILDGLHWVLPKTTDADFVVASLRRSVTQQAPMLADSGGALSVEDDPSGFEREGPAEADLGLAPAVWIARDAQGTETARLELSRTSRRETDAKGRQRLRAPSTAAARFADELEQREGLGSKPRRASRPAPESLQFAWVAWRERAGEQDLERRRGFTGLEANMYVVDATFTPEHGPVDEIDGSLARFLRSLRVERKSADNLPAQEWYAQVFRWGGPLRTNALVSIGTSILFALIMLLAARWRLARIDF
jgi:hypothetical protein